ncbi:hypothetical protein [Prochlorococcus marinus]|uniref:hypothetical protein n=1 Tax=Prochlorococcus marinus TaxID=1219 RepID=UPI0022B2C80D|nr:hypothetical protein [Prochlorococcus marinus]
MSLALTDRTFLDLGAWWDCLSKSELIKLSWFSAQPSMNLHSSRYPNQAVFRIQITKLKKKILTSLLITIIAMLLKAQFVNPWEISD